MTKTICDRCKRSKGEGDWLDWEVLKLGQAGSGDWDLCQNCYAMFKECMRHTK